MKGTLATAALVLLAGCASSPKDGPPPPPAPIVNLTQPQAAPAAPVAPPPAPVATPAPVAKPAPAPRTFAAMRPGSRAETITVATIKRSYVLHVPKGYDPIRAIPLVVVLHARGSSAKGASVYGFDGKGDREGFAVVYPEAMGQPHVWNAVHDRGTNGANDTAYVLAVIDAVAEQMNIDPRRVYLFGSSSGGMMAYRLAAEHPQRFAAAAVFAGSIGTRNPKGVLMQVPKPAEPVSVLHVHGRADRTVPYTGGKSVTLPGADYVSAADSTAFWAAADGCEPKPRSNTTGPITRDVYGACRGGAAVELLSIAAVSHSWPATLRPNPKKPAQATIDVVWDFLRQHARP